MKTPDDIVEFELSIYPCALWVTLSSDLEYIFERFDVASMNNFYTACGKTVSQIVNEYPINSCATTTPVIERETDKIGVLVILNSECIQSTTVAHESVHVADYVFELTNSNSEDFSIGNEPYAHLVGWAAGCIFKVIKDVKDGSKEKRWGQDKSRSRTNVYDRKPWKDIDVRSVKIRR